MSQVTTTDLHRCWRRTRLRHGEPLYSDAGPSDVARAGGSDKSVFHTLRGFFADSCSGKRRLRAIRPCAENPRGGASTSHAARCAEAPDGQRHGLRRVTRQITDQWRSSATADEFIRGIESAVFRSLSLRGEWGQARGARAAPDDAKRHRAYVCGPFLQAMQPSEDFDTIRLQQAGAIRAASGRTDSTMADNVDERSVAFGVGMARPN